MNGTLVNSPTYSSSNGGVLVFNGSSQYVGSFVNTSALPASGPYTYEVWFNATSLGSRGFIGYGTYGTNNSVNAFRESGTELLNYWWGNDFSSIGASLATGNWYQAVVTFDGTTRSIYLNGVFLNSQNPGTFYSISNKTNLTVAVTNGSEYFAGSLAIIRMYSAALTQSQIYQNYNATRSRFGLAASPTPSVTPSLTPTPSITTTPSLTPTASISPTASITPTASVSITPTNSVTPSTTPAPSPSNSPAPTPSQTPTRSLFSPSQLEKAH